jgi:hypothetical protein
MEVHIGSNVLFRAFSAVLVFPLLQSVNDVMGGSEAVRLVLVHLDRGDVLPQGGGSGLARGQLVVQAGLDALHVRVGGWKRNHADGHSDGCENDCADGDLSHVLHVLLLDDGLLAVLHLLVLAHVVAATRNENQESAVPTKADGFV